MAISRRLRFEILRRDGFACRYCGDKAPDVKLTVDHVIAVTLGGGDEPNNLVTACQPCNAGKSSIPVDAELVADVDASALLWAKAVERAAAQRIAERGATYDKIYDWSVGSWETFTNPTTGDLMPRPDGWEDTIERFLSLSLTVDDLKHYTSVAMDSSAGNANVWRYFCGCCWNEVSRRQELARTMLEDGEV